MSAVEPTERYWAMARYPIGHQVVDSARGFETVDQFRTRSAAEYFAQLLNSGLASVNAHATIGAQR